MKLMHVILFFLFMGVAAPLHADDNKQSNDNKQGEKQGGPEVRRIVLSRRKEGEPEGDQQGKESDKLIEKADKERQDKLKQTSETKVIEQALQFNMSVDDFVKRNQDVLPKDAADIVRIANTENYDSAQAKASAIKAALIQKFFSVQANVDNLTRSQRDQLDDYLKLTNTGKQERAASIYENILEPALETHRKVRKAEELARSRLGFTQGTEGQNAYRDKLLKGSRKTYLGEKEA